MKKEMIKRELDRIAKEHGHILRPADVVEAARSKESILHSQFEWDDTEAAEQYRLSQARGLIRVIVEYSGPNDTGDSNRVYVSLKSDRAMEGGYRTMVSVMSDVELRAQLLADAMADMESFRRKYNHLKELADVFSAMASAKKRKKVA